MLKIQLTCGKHKRYNPEVHGQAGIRGACKACTALFVLYTQYLQARQLMPAEEESE